MPIRFNPDNSFELTISQEEAELLWHLITCIRPSKETTLDLNVERMTILYNRANWLVPGYIPYEVICDSDQFLEGDWLPLRWNPEPFALPMELRGHRDRMVEMLRGSKQLRITSSGEVDDQRCPRLMEVEDDGSLSLQPARYTDQVATNLSLDYPLEGDLAHRFGATLRDVDLKFILEGTHLREHPVEQGHLRPLRDSFLANTLGVCCLIVCADGKIPYRFRRNKTAIYQDQAHVLVSFAQELPGAWRPKSLAGLVGSDLGTEFFQETGLEFGAVVKAVKPLAMCRDISRAGKPQLFLLLVANYGSEELIRRLKVHKPAESERQVYIVERGREVADISPELAASLSLVRRYGVITDSIAAN